jgi:hypothetical protein
MIAHPIPRIRAPIERAPSNPTSARSFAQKRHHGDHQMSDPNTMIVTRPLLASSGPAPPRRCATIAARLIGVRRAHPASATCNHWLPTQHGIGASPAAKAALTITALGATAYDRVLGKSSSRPTALRSRAARVPLRLGPAGSRPETPADVAGAQQLKVTQWLIPALTAESPLSTL